MAATWPPTAPYAAQNYSLHRSKDVESNPLSDMPPTKPPKNYQCKGTMHVKSPKNGQQRIDKTMAFDLPAFMIRTEEG